MRREILLELSGPELDAYAKKLGLNTSKTKGIKAKVDVIETTRGRVAEIEALGMTLRVPVKRMHDLRVTDRLNGQGLNDAEYERLCADILGKDQLQEVYEHCTDEDGTVDLEAVALVLDTVILSDELKNF